MRPPPRRANRLAWQMRPPARRANRLAWQMRPPARRANRLAWEMCPPARRANRLAWQMRPPARRANRLAWQMRPPAKRPNRLAWQMCPPAKPTAPRARGTRLSARLTTLLETPTCRSAKLARSSATPMNRTRIAAPRLVVAVGGAPIRGGVLGRRGRRPVFGGVAIFPPHLRGERVEDHLLVIVRHLRELHEDAHGGRVDVPAAHELERPGARLAALGRRVLEEQVPVGGVLLRALPAVVDAHQPERGIPRPVVAVGGLVGRLRARAGSRRRDGGRHQHPCQAGHERAL